MKTVNINLDVTAASAADLWAKIDQIEEIASPNLLDMDGMQAEAAQSSPAPSLSPVEGTSSKPDAALGSMIVPKASIDPGVNLVRVPIWGSCPVLTDGFHFALGIYGDAELVGSSLGPFFNDKAISAGIRPIHAVAVEQNGRPVRYVEYGVTLTDIRNGAQVEQFTVPDNTVLAELEFKVALEERNVTLWLQQNFFRSGPHAPGSTREWNEFTNRKGRPFRDIKLTSGSIVRE